jgi:hypothetical protein
MPNTRILTSGYNAIINQKAGATSTPIYPITKVANIYDADGNGLDDIISTLAVRDETKEVPDYSSETTSSLRFLRNDRTWATIQDGTTSQKGVVQLYNGVDSDSTELAATAASVKSVKTAVDTLETTAESTYAKLAQIGVATAGTVKGIAELDTTGKVPSAQLPSFVDDVIEIAAMKEDFTEAYSDAQKQHPITPESGKVYILTTDNSTYRWSGSVYAPIRGDLTLGETETTAYRGDRGKVAYDHSQEAHAPAGAHIVSQSETNGYVTVTDRTGAETEVLVYTHPQAAGATSTNPHGTTASDVGLGNVENKDVATILSEMTSTNVTTALGYTPQNAATLATASNNGVMSSTYASKLDKCMETAVSATAPTFDGTGIWFEIVE